MRNSLDSISERDSISNRLFVLDLVSGDRLDPEVLERLLDHYPDVFEFRIVLVYCHHDERRVWPIVRCPRRRQLSGVGGQEKVCEIQGLGHSLVETPGSGGGVSKRDFLVCRRIYPEHRTFVVVDVDSGVTVFAKVHIREHLPRIVPKLLHVRIRQQR